MKHHYSVFAEPTGTLGRTRYRAQVLALPDETVVRTALFETRPAAQTALREWKRKYG